MNTIFPLMNAVWLAHLDTANPEKALDTSPDNRSKKKKIYGYFGWGCKLSGNDSLL